MLDPKYRPVSIWFLCNVYIHNIDLILPSDVSLLRQVRTSIYIEPHNGFSPTFLKVGEEKM
jgi:hypothetical protein